VGLKRTGGRGLVHAVRLSAEPLVGLKRFHVLGGENQIQTFSRTPRGFEA